MEEIKTPIIEEIEDSAIKEIKDRINILLGDSKKRIVSAEEWVDIAGNLVLLKGNILNNRRVAGMKANRELKKIRAVKGTKADAEIEWKSTDEYEGWQKQEDALSDFESLERVARNEAQIRKANTF